MSPSVLNVSKANEIAMSNETALATTEQLKCKQRNRSQSDIEKVRKEILKKGIKIVDADYSQYWRDLQTAGFGSVIYGRKGNSDKFAWNYNLKDVAAVALGSSNTSLSPKGEILHKGIKPTKVKPTRGRPKGSKNAPKVTRGRPKGSKNLIKLTPKEAALIQKVLARFV